MTTVGILICLLGLRVVFSSFILTILFRPFPTCPLDKAPAYWSMVHMGLIIGIFGIIFLIVGIGILLLKNWARILFLWQMGLWVVYGLCSSYAFVFAGANLSKTILNFLLRFFLPVLLSFYFFTRPKVKRAFGERNPERSEG